MALVAVVTVGLTVDAFEMKRSGMDPKAVAELTPIELTAQVLLETQGILAKAMEDIEQVKAALGIGE